MAGISIISNFDLSSENPIDFRIVASNSTERDNIFYKYIGLKTYDLSDNKTYTWNGSTWSREGNGIYGGSGSLIGNTEVNIGTIGDTTGSQSNVFSFTTNTTDNSILLSNKFIRTSLTDISFVYGLFDYSLTQSYISLSNNSININDRFLIEGYNTSTPTQVSVSNGTYNGKIYSHKSFSNLSYYLPNKDGEIALTSSIPTLGTQNLQSVTTYGNTTSVGIRLNFSPTLTAFTLTYPLYGSPSYSVFSSFNDTSLNGMYYRIARPQISTNPLSAGGKFWGITLRSWTASTSENAIQFNGRYPDNSTGASVDLRIYSNTASSDRTIYFPDSSGTVSLTSNIPTGTNQYAYYELKVDNNITLGPYGGTTTPLYPGGATATFLNLTPTTLTSNRNLEIPGPTLSNIGWTLIIRFKQPSTTNYLSTIPYYVPSSGTQSIIPNGVTSLISDGTRWTRWAFSNGGLTTE